MPRSIVRPLKLSFMASARISPTTVFMATAAMVKATVRTTIWRKSGQPKMNG